MSAWLLLLALQAPAATAPPVETHAVEAPAAPPFAGALHEGLVELRTLSYADEHREALDLAASLLAAPVLEELDEPARARVLFDVGVARARATQQSGLEAPARDALTRQALSDFRAAGALAGPGVLREKAAYDAGTTLLSRAEELRLAVPEIAEALGAPVPPPAGPAQAQEQGPDPLELARAAYLAARAELLGRLRLAWEDEDTRANLELTSRRLRELDGIEREREQQEEQQNPNPQDEPQQQDPQDQEPPEDQQGEPDEQQDQQQQDPQDQQGEQQEPSPEEQPEDEQGEEQPPEPEPSEDESQAEEQQQEQQADPDQAQEERALSREEVLRLLDRLEEIEEQARAVRALLQERRRKPVEKDW